MQIISYILKPHLYVKNVIQYCQINVIYADIYVITNV